MLAENKRNTNIGVGVGLILQIAGQVLIGSTDPIRAMAALALIVAGFCAFIWGCSQYARGKGHSPWFGALGILSILGLIVLVLLPDRHKEARA
jgi:hypothetical protein